MDGGTRRTFLDVSPTLFWEVVDYLNEKEDHIS